MAVGNSGALLLIALIGLATSPGNAVIAQGPNEVKGAASSDLIFLDSFETELPQFLGYPTSNYEFIVGLPIQTIAPTVLGGASNFAIAPSLPSGLAFSASTGAISGTPDIASARTDYLVTAINANGSDAGTVSIRTSASFVYTGSPYTLFRGVEITPIGPSVSGDFSGFWIIPDLPTGLSIDPASGTISGTPSVTSALSAYVATASDINGDDQATLQLQVLEPAPSGLSYPNAPFEFIVDQPISTQVPNVHGLVTAYAIAPGLPSGLSFSTSTGTISGTPNVATAAANYTVTASNGTGSTETVVSIAVSGSFFYTGSPFTFQRGVAITPFGPTGTGGFSNFEIDPALPAGLGIDADTGVISGTAATTSGATSYLVTGEDASGPSLASISIAVVEPAPTNLVYANAPFVFQQSVSIAPQTPSVDGAVSAFAIHPALPAGLLFNSSDGTLSGSPSVVTPFASYTVTASNAAGSTQVVIGITVNGVVACDGVEIAGACWYFGANNQSCDQVCSTHGGYSEITRSHAGSDGSTNNCGNVLTSLGAVNPTPVADAASIDGITGLGCASDYSDNATSFRVTSATTSAANSSASSRSVRRACACNDQPPPVSIVYSGAPFVFTQGVGVAPQFPTVNGFVSSFAISPSLPAGLTFDSGTGVISGTPSEVDAVDSYTVTASNAGGFVQTQFQLRVDGAPPSSLSYANAPFLFNQGVPIATQAPTVVGQVTSYAILPALPSGLSFNSGSGAISGTPSATSAANNYTVTASNAFGQAQVVFNLQVVAATACDGNVVGGFCWWLGANGESCTTVCSLHGGYNSGTQTYAGSGGNNTQCGSVASALVAQGLLNPTPVAAAANIAGVGGLGCASDYSSTATTYRITTSTTAAAAQGSTRRMCACNDQPAPVSISYAGTPFSLPKDIPMAPRSPTVSGYVKTFSIAPSLPAGLSLNAGTGVVSGTPTSASPSTTYTVTGSNSAGQVQTSFDLSVFVQAPTSLNYPLSAYVFPQGETITPQAPSFTGSNATSYSINSALPAGLSFNTGTGIISGTPTTVSAASNRTITVFNSAGSTGTVVSVQVSAPVSCAGASVGGFCWYFGSNNQSCDTVCATHGGYNAGTATFAGSGGTASNCKAVLTAVGAAGGGATPIEQASIGGISALGCGSDYSDLATSYRITSATTSAASSSSNSSLFFRRVCACTN